MADAESRWALSRDSICQSSRECFRVKLAERTCCSFTSSLVSTESHLEHVSLCMSGSDREKASMGLHRNLNVGMSKRKIKGYEHGENVCDCTKEKANIFNIVLKGS